MKFTKPIVKKLKKEFKAILRDIRKHGRYSKDELLDNRDLMIELLTK